MEQDQAEGETKAENAEDQTPQSRNLYDLSEYSSDEKKIELVQCRIDAIPEFARFTSLESICLRQNLITTMNCNLGDNSALLVELDLSDNQITEIHGLDGFVNLRALDLGYNRIGTIQGLSSLENLQRLYLVHNKLAIIEGLERLTKLRLLELGDNRIKKLENLNHLTELEELYVGGNRIQRMENIEALSKLRILSLPGNHLTKLEGLENFPELEELHVSDQGLKSLEGIEHVSKLKILDAGNNSISSLGDTLAAHEVLEDLWLNGNKISAWSEVDRLSSLKSLRTVYLEMNPIQEMDRNSYRRKVIMALSQVKQVDATTCR